MVFDTSKVGAFLEDCSRQFEAILKAEDEGNGEGVEAVLEEMQSCENAPIVKHLIEKLFHKAKKGEAASAWYFSFFWLHLSVCFACYLLQSVHNL